MQPRVVFFNKPRVLAVIWFFAGQIGIAYLVLMADHINIPFSNKELA